MDKKLQLRQMHRNWAKTWYASSWAWLPTHTLRANTFHNSFVVHEVWWKQLLSCRFSSEDQEEPSAHKRPGEVAQFQGLSVVFDSILTFRQHIKMIKTGIKLKLASFSHIQSFLTLQTTKTYMNTIIF